MRKLATIRKIDKLEFIRGADAIETATIDGWKVVVKRGEYHKGDYVIYCEVDSWIPHELAPFLSRGNPPREFNGVLGERLRTIKLRGQLSQGLVLPVPEFVRSKWLESDSTEDETYDASELLGIQKWEPHVVEGNQRQGAVSNWPAEIPKTDEERIQNLTREWDELRGLDYEVTEKLEGSSMTVGKLHGEFIVCSRNVKLDREDGGNFWAVAIREDLELKMQDFDNLVLQGELIGPGIQGNYYDLPRHEFYVFGVYSIKDGVYLNPYARRGFCQSLGLKHAPVIDPSFCPEAYSVEEILSMADGFSSFTPTKPYRRREGLVFKENYGEQRHWKAVSNEYLLKEK
jgi:RNA ligase (TIGR02306 family)